MSQAEIMSESAAVEDVDLISLVEHREAIQATETTEDVY